MIQHQSVYKYKEGFTLIETIIYVALFGMLFSGILVSSYSFITAAEHISAQVLVENETAFVVWKINTLLVSADTIINPVPNTSDTILSFTTYSKDTYKISMNEKVIMIKKNNTAEVPMTSERVTFDTFSVNYKTALDGIPSYVEYSFTIDGKETAPIRNYFTF